MIFALLKTGLFKLCYNLFELVILHFSPYNELKGLIRRKYTQLIGLCQIFKNMFPFCQVSSMNFLIRLYNITSFLFWSPTIILQYIFIGLGIYSKETGYFYWHSKDKIIRVMQKIYHIDYSDAKLTYIDIKTAINGNRIKKYQMIFGGLIIDMIKCVENHTLRISIDGGWSGTNKDLIKRINASMR